MQGENYTVCPFYYKQFATRQRYRQTVDKCADFGWAKYIILVKANEDAVHSTVLTLHHVEFLQTWKCRHIANPVILEIIVAYLEKQCLCLSGLKEIGGKSVCTVQLDFRFDSSSPTGF